MLRKNLVAVLAAIGVMVVWGWLMFLEIWDVLEATSGQAVVRSDLRVAVLTMLTGMLGATLGMLAAVPSSWDRLSTLRPLFGFGADRIATALYLLYGVLYIAGIVAGIVVAVTYEEEASTLLIAASAAGVGTIATGVAAWMGISWAPHLIDADGTNGNGYNGHNGPATPTVATSSAATPSAATTASSTTAPSRLGEQQPDPAG